MLGSLLKAAVKTAVLPVSIAADTLFIMSDAGDEGVGHRTADHINSIADDLNDVL